MRKNPRPEGERLGEGKNPAIGLLLTEKCVYQGKPANLQAKIAPHPASPRGGEEKCVKIPRPEGERLGEGKKLIIGQLWTEKRVYQGKPASLYAKIAPHPVSPCRGEEKYAKSLALKGRG
jgi:hypothetical protein